MKEDHSCFDDDDKLVTVWKGGKMETDKLAEVVENLDDRVKHIERKFKITNTRIKNLDVLICPKCGGLVKPSKLTKKPLCKECNMFIEGKKNKRGAE